MSKLNPNAKPFAFNIKASSFVPTQFTAAAAAAAAPANNNNTPAPAAAASAPAPATTPASAPAPTSAPAAAKPAATVTVIGASKPAATVTVIGGKPKETPKPAAAPSTTPAPVPAAAASAPTPSPAATKPVTDSWEDLDNTSSSSSSSSSSTTAPAPSSSTITPAAAPSTSSSSSAPAAADEEDEPELTEEEKKELAEIEAAEAAEEAAAAEEKNASSDSSDASGKAEKKSAPQKAYHDEREHLNIVFIGHVDAGKSTISGQILFQTGQVDRRTIEKYEKEAKEKNRESWYLAYVMDTSEEERNRGKTVEVGRAHFSTAKKRYTLLDAPGHRSYVPNMIGGASQADVGVLVISARKGEFEAGLERGGQTREHAMLAKTLGLSRLIVLINKMDDKSVEWSKERYDEIVDKLSPVLKRWGYNLKTDVFYTPCSGLTGAGIKDPLADDIATWLPKDHRRSFFQILDDLPPMDRDVNAPLRLPVMAKYKDMGATFVIGKLESGSLYGNRKLFMSPNQKEVTCTGVAIDEVDVDYARPGENVLVKLKGIEEEEIQTGFVLSYPDNPCKRARKFDASVVVLDLLEHKPILTAGYSCVLHLHTLTVECIISGLISETDKKTGEKSKRRPKFAKSGAIVECRIAMEQSVAIETFKDFPQLGRFTLRDEGKTIMIGKVTKIFPE